MGEHLPGDTIHNIDFIRNDEIGFVRIQWYANDSYRVASFLPGRDVFNPGDTPKMEPEKSEWVSVLVQAEAVMARFNGEAINEGWKMETNNAN